jgi:hypothetical protein
LVVNRDRLANLGLAARGLARPAAVESIVEAIFAAAFFKDGAAS